MIDEREIVRVAVERLAPPEPAYERLVERRDRNRRNQRIAAGVVGIAVFVAAVWIVTSVGSLDRSETSVVPGGDITGPAVTGPAEIGPAETGLAKAARELYDGAEAPNGWYDGGDPEYDLPPEDAVPSTPEEGKLVAQYGGIFPTRFVYVYADGRVISWVDPAGGTSPSPGWINERRLTLEGVELVRSGAVQPEDFMYPTSEIPADAWKDPEIKPFVPSRYAVCYWGVSGNIDASTAVRFFPTPARAILRVEKTHLGPECSEVTTDEARTLLDILGSTAAEFTTPHVRVEDSEGNPVDWDIGMILPHGERPCTGCG